MIYLLLVISTVAFLFGLVWFINYLTDEKLRHLEEAVLDMGQRLDAMDESIMTLGQFSNSMNFQIQIDRYNFSNHMYTCYHGIKEMDKIIKWEVKTIKDEEMIAFRNWGIHLNELGKSNGYLPRQDYVVGGAEITDSL